MWNGSTSSGQPAGGSSVRGDTRVPGSEPPASADPASTRERVVALRREGRSATQIATALGVSKSTVCYHLRRLGVEPDERCNRRYDWGAIQRFYDEGHSVTECLAHFGCSRKSFHDAWKRGRISTRPQAMPLGQLLAEPRQRGHIKLRLLRLGLKENRCEACGIDSWRGSPLAMALHHVNGDGRDNRLENLQLLCPNCHSQTPNFAGRNRGRRLVAGA